MVTSNNLNQVVYLPELSCEICNVLINGQIFAFDGATTQARVPCAERIEVRIIVTSSDGCTDETTKVFDNIPGVNDRPGPTIEFVGGNEVTVCPGQPIQLIANPNSAYTYTWTPTTGLTFTSDTDFSIQQLVLRRRQLIL